MSRRVIKSPTIMGEAMDKGERLLNLLSALLKSREGLIWPEIEQIEGYGDARPLRSRQKRFERDLHDLEAAGLTITLRTEEGAKRRYSLDRSNALLPTLDLTPEQRLLLYRVGRGYLESGGAGPMQHYLSSALLKLQAGSGLAAMPDELPRSGVMRNVLRRPAEAKHLQAIGVALLERRRIKFKYTDRDRRQSTRAIAPYALVCRRGGWYLVGYDGERKAERTFRLTRMAGKVTQADAKSRSGEYEIPTHFDPERNFASDHFGRGLGAFKGVRVRFDADVAFMVENEFEGIHRIERLAGGARVLHLKEAFGHELFRYLGEFAGHWQVLGPRELREFVVGRLKGSLKANK
ncbi:MAG: WYL domain-containing protein [Planctomycetes bacterium]|nr:WYL domain-containing protein [Planctomycetota bacterium]